MLNCATTPGFVATGDAPRPETNPARRILVVEDDEIQRKLNAELLIGLGHAVDIAEDGAAAWEELRARTYDLLITDNSMPKMSGLELLKLLRTSRMGLPVIMATGVVPVQELAQNPGLAPVSALPKPYTQDQLLRAVDEILRPSIAKADQPRTSSIQSEEITYSVERYAGSRKLEWDAFVETAKNATFLFQRDYMDYHRDRFEDHSMMVFKEGTLAAVLPANLDASGALVSHEGLTYGGFVVSRLVTLCDMLACFHALLRDLNKRGISKLLFKPVPGFYSTLPNDDVAYALFLLEARLYRRECSTAVNQLDRLPLSRHHARLAKRAMGSGVRIILDTDFRAYWEQVLVPQLAARYEARPVHTLEEITLLASRFPGHIKQYSAYCGDKIVAGTTIFETPNVAHVQYSAVTDKGRQIGAQALLFSSLIDQYQAKHFFDFGTSNEKHGLDLNHGLLDWKEGFGARCYTHDFYEIQTGNFPKLEPGLPIRPTASSSSTPAAPKQASALVDQAVGAGFTHPQALIEPGVSIGRGTRVWAFAHIVAGSVLGEDCNVCDHTFIEGGVRIGNRVTIKCGVSLWDGLTIEDDVFIGPGAIFTNDNRPRSKRHLKVYPQTVLKQGSTLGAGSTTLPGITIGRWAMVGAGSVVTHDVPDHALVVGSPARFRAWVCCCGEKLSPSAGQLMDCECGLCYELIGKNEVRAFALNARLQILHASRTAENPREPLGEDHGLHSGNGRMG